MCMNINWSAQETGLSRAPNEALQHYSKPPSFSQFSMFICCTTVKTLNCGTKWAQLIKAELWLFMFLKSVSWNVFIQSAAHGPETEPLVRQENCWLDLFSPVLLAQMAQSLKHCRSTTNLAWAKPRHQSLVCIAPASFSLVEAFILLINVCINMSSPPPSPFWNVKPSVSTEVNDDTIQRELWCQDRKSFITEKKKLFFQNIEICTTSAQSIYMNCTNLQQFITTYPRKNKLNTIKMYWH